jgi:hypothetical protein
MDNAGSAGSPALVALIGRARSACTAGRKPSSWRSNGDPNGFEPPPGTSEGHLGTTGTGDPTSLISFRQGTLPPMQTVASRLPIGTRAHHMLLVSAPEDHVGALSRIHEFTRTAVPEGEITSRWGYARFIDEQDWLDIEDGESAPCYRDEVYITLRIPQQNPVPTRLASLGRLAPHDATGRWPRRYAVRLASR